MRRKLDAIALLLLSFSPLVFGYTYDATPLETGNLAIFCVFALLFLVEIALCFIALIIARGFRTPLAVLLPAIIFYFLSCLNGIANDVAFANGDDFPPPDLIIATNAMLEFFPDWGNVLLFLAVCLAFFNRQAALNRHSSGNSGPVSIFQYIGLALHSLLLFILATAAGGLITAYLNVLYGDQFDLTVRDLAHKFNNYKHVSYAFESFLIVSAFFVLFCAVMLFQAMKKAAASDAIQASKVLIYGMTPLYAVYMVVVMAFTIINSPAGLKANASLTSLDSSADANAVLTNFFFFAVALLLIILGFRRSSYAIGNPSYMTPPQVPMQTWPQSGYYPYPQPQAQGYYYAQYPDPIKSAPSVGDNMGAGAPPAQFHQ
ncbi:hypothetical protein SCHPADRAFT_890109 [Schizopora paradoxa]|uniref:RTA1-domain-containing protein n=1 Tax=Schizopora paradoxa TaxID=27342 RepID=A0A0H2RN05_9AGAM|nr:hypothetical protein SCHPADRAFT_890109 [Schizopora paradoxa]